MSSVGLSLPTLLDLMEYVAAPVVQTAKASAPASVTKTSVGKRAKGAPPKTNSGDAKTKATLLSAASASAAYLTVKQVAVRFSVSVATIWRWNKDNPDFPKPIHLSAGTTRWPVVEIEAFELSLRAR